MIIVEIQELNEYHIHNNQTTSEQIIIPEGWALLPQELYPERNFPYGIITYEVINGIPTITSWTIVEPPIPPEPEPKPNPIADLDEIVLDHEERLILLEVGD